MTGCSPSYIYNKLKNKKQIPLHQRSSKTYQKIVIADWRKIDIPNTPLTFLTAHFPVCSLSWSLTFLTAHFPDCSLSWPLTFLTAHFPDRSLSWFGTCTSIKSNGVKLFLWTLFSEMIWLCMSFHVLVQSHIHVGLTFNNGHRCPVI